MIGGVVDMPETAAYVYCIVRGARPSFRRVPAGLPGATRPDAVQLQRSTWMIAADVPLHTYGPEALEPALRDLHWVADIAVAHDAVVEHFARQRNMTVVPMKLFTMFSSSERAVAELNAKLGDIEEVLRRIAGCEEWGVRVVAAAAGTARLAQTAATSGAAFLAAKKEARAAARDRSRRAAAAAEDVFLELDALTRAAWRRQTVPDGVTAPPLLDAAFLVPLKQRTRFRAAARRLAAHCATAGAELTLTGPWPAYSFVRPAGTS